MCYPSSVLQIRKVLDIAYPMMTATVKNVATISTSEKPQVRLVFLVTYSSHDTCKTKYDCACHSNLIPPQTRLCFSSNECLANETCYLIEGPDTKFKEYGWCASYENVKRLQHISPLVDLSKCSDSNSTQVHSLDQYYPPDSTCTLSSNCYKGDTCTTLTHSGAFAECSRQLFDQSFSTPCFCKQIYATSYFNPYVCAVNNDNIPFRDTKYTCVPCSTIATLSPDIPGISSLCQKKFPEPLPPRRDDIFSSFLEKCSSQQGCKNSLGCVTQYPDGSLAVCPQYPFDHSCFCFDTDWKICNIVQPCKRCTKCVRLSAGGQFCIKSDLPARIQQEVHPVYTFPWWFGISLFAIEMISSASSLQLCFMLKKGSVFLEERVSLWNPLLDYCLQFYK